jgi:hypothetical protein
LAPAEVYACLLDQGLYLCSIFRRLAVAHAAIHKLLRLYLPRRYGQAQLLFGCVAAFNTPIDEIAHIGEQADCYFGEFDVAHGHRYVVSPP